MALRDDYAGPFDPDLTLADFSRSFLVRLGYEYLLIGHLLDRVGQPLVGMLAGAEGFVRSAVDEWMGASPIYTKRVQQLLGYSGDTIDTMFKGLQLDIGAPPEFMDFRLRVIDDTHGEFWLDHCGALMDVCQVAGYLAPTEAEHAKRLLERVVSMLTKLCRG